MKELQSAKKFTRMLKYLGISSDEIHSNASFTEDFEFDTFKMGCLFFYLENYFQVSIPEEQTTTMKTIGDVADYLNIELVRI